MKTKKTDHKPVIRIVTGITAAAACLGITGAFGYALYNMKQDSAQLPAGTQLESEITEQIDPAADDREFPLFGHMTEEQRVRIFDWGTIRLESVELREEQNRLAVAYRIHLNDDIECMDQDWIDFSPMLYMYDTGMLHRVWGVTLHASIAPATPIEAHRDFIYRAEYALPAEENRMVCETLGVVCETLGEDGEYHQTYDDFLEKEPMPEYLLYETRFEYLSVIHDDEPNYLIEKIENEQDMSELKAYRANVPHCPGFKFRLADLPAEDEEPVEVIAETPDDISEEYPVFDVQNPPDLTIYHKFGMVQVIGAGYTEDENLPYIELALNPDDGVREKIEQGAETYIRYTANGHIGDEYWFSMDQGMNFAKVYPTEDGNYGAVITFAPATRELYHILNENGEYVSECGNPNETVSWADMCIDLHFNELFVRSSPFEGENTQGILQRDVLSYDFANQSETPLLKFRFPDPADCTEASESEPVYELFSALPEEQRIFTDKFGTFRLDEITDQDDLPILSYSIKLSDELQIPEKVAVDVAVYAYPVIIGHNGDWTKTIVADASVEEINEFTAGKPDADGWYHFRIALASASGEFRSGDLIDCRLFNVSYCAAYSSNAVELYQSDEADNGKNGICFKLG